MKMCSFKLEVFCADPNDPFILKVTDDAKRSIESEIAPHVDWQITLVTTLGAEQRPCDGLGLTHWPKIRGNQTITIKPQVLMWNHRRWTGLTLSTYGTIDLELLQTSGFPEDVLINEWLHTISQKRINGRYVGNADLGNDGTPPRYHDKYKRMLRWEADSVETALSPPMH